MGSLYRRAVWRLPAPVAIRVHFRPKAKGLRAALELTALAILSHTVPGKTFAVHGDVNPMRQRLNERECAAEIEESVGAAKCLGDHRAG